MKEEFNEMDGIKALIRERSKRLKEIKVELRVLRAKKKALTKANQDVEKSQTELKKKEEQNHSPTGQI